MYSTTVARFDLLTPNGAVSFLPGKFADLVGHPSRRICLDGLDGLGNCNGRGELQEQMNMVLYSADGMNKYLLVFANSGGVRPEPFFHIRRNDLTSLFGAEYDVHYVLKIGMGQCVTPPGFVILHDRFPRAHALG